MGEATRITEAEAGGQRIPTRNGRSLGRRIAQELGFADLMAVLMVAATAMSAFASWRIATLTQTLFAVAERPYIGIAGVSFDSAEGGASRLRVDFRNFGHVSATDGVVRVWVIVNGKRLPHKSDAATTMNVGMISPTVPHLFYSSVPNDIHEAVAGGRAKMVVRGKIFYRGPDQRQFCYDELFNYDQAAGAFVSTGGNDRCDGAIY